jgi:hypothetical protein
VWTGRQPKTKSLFIPQCYDTFGGVGRRKQHIVPNVSVSFVSSVDLICLWSSVIRGSRRLCVKYHAFCCENLLSLWSKKLWTKVWQC